MYRHHAVVMAFLLFKYGYIICIGGIIPQSRGTRLFKNMDIYVLVIYMYICFVMMRQSWLANFMTFGPNYNSAMHRNLEITTGENFPNYQLWRYPPFECWIVQSLFLTHGHTFSESYYIKPKSDCIYHFQINLVPNGRSK